MNTSPSGNQIRTRIHDGGLSPDSETNPLAITKHTMHLGGVSDGSLSHSNAAALANNHMQQHQHHHHQQQQRAVMLGNAPDPAGVSTVPRWVSQQQQSPHHQQLQRQIMRNKMYNDASMIPQQSTNPHESVNNLSVLHGGISQDSPSVLNYGGRRQQQLLGQHQQGAYLVRQNSGGESLGPNSEGNVVGNNGVVSATAKYRAAGIVAAAARAERDYHLATLHLQTKLAEAAERRALTNLSATMRAPMKDDFEVAQACLNLRTDSKEGMYPHMIDPNYARLSDISSRRNGSDLSSSMSNGSIMPNASYGGHRYLNQNQQALSLMDAHMHPLQSVPLDSLSHDMHANGPMGGGMHYMPEYHSSGPGSKRKHDPSAEGEYTKKMKSAFQGSEISSMAVKPQDNKKGKRPADMPRRPLSAYNFFFSEERERVLASLPSPDGKDDPKKKSDSEDKDKGMDKDKDKDTDKSKEVKAEGVADTPPTSEEGDATADKAPKNLQSNQERLLSLRLVQHNVRRPHRKTHGKIGFKALAKLIGERWRALTPEKKEPYRKLAETDLARYKEQMEEYNRKNKWAFLQESEHHSPAGK